MSLKWTLVLFGAGVGLLTWSLIGAAYLPHATQVAFGGAFGATWVGAALGAVIAR